MEIRKEERGVQRVMTSLRIVKNDRELKRRGDIENVMELTDNTEMGSTEVC